MLLWRFFNFNDSSKINPWQWRSYTGANAHREHVHISVMGDPELYDDPRPWQIGPVTAEPDVPGRQTNITATRFSDSQVAYVDVAPGWNDRYGVALPFRLDDRWNHDVFDLCEECAEQFRDSFMAFLSVDGPVEA